MKKQLIGSILVCIVAFIWLPLWILLSGITMGSTELCENPVPVLEGDGGTVVWPVIVQYPILQAYAELFLDTPQFFTVFWNSYRQVLPIIFGHVLLSASAARALARFHFRGKKVLYTLYVVSMLMPFQVTMVSSYLVLNRLRLVDTVWAVILPGAVSTFPTFIITRLFMTVPEAIMEAATVDGAPPLQTFVWFGTPLGAAGILSAVVLGLLEYWNAMEASQAFLKNQALWPLSLHMADITVGNAGISLIASLIILMLPPLIFLFGQRYLEQGIMSSGIKD